ncbi:AMP-binding protein [Paraburkholderia sp. J94]|uniref:AMP-binding protein n=1 Tax=Paraburkholderia sp. J94 TaxID=2805441 RepID=UPI002AB32639|nr:AMP-binding protein [Paraburkholderia sp. J94]
MNPFGAQACLIDTASGATLRGGDLDARIEAMSRELRGFSAGLLLLPVGWDIDSVCRYLAALHAHRPVALLAPDADSDTLAELCERFQPAGVWQDHAPPDRLPIGYERTQHGLRRIERAAPTHPELALLMTTSGSTGAARMVRLSRAGVLANAHAIVAALDIGAHDVAPTSLPFHLGYGLSVLNSHLAAGATVLVTAEPVISPGFWSAVDRHRATSFAAVPHTYELLARLHWRPGAHPSLRVLTQSGSRMRAELAELVAGDMERVGGRFHLMYGQTEATARMAVLPADQLHARSASVGLAVPGARLTIRTEDGVDTQAPDISGEVIFHGPSVMMGYADDAAALSLGDEHHGVLQTGDIGHFDTHGYLFLEGRLKRMAKIFGLRINLDAVERFASEAGAPGASAAVSRDDDAIVLWCEGEPDPARLDRLARSVAERLRLNRRGVEARAIEHLPVLSNGKVDYRMLAAAAHAALDTAVHPAVAPRSIDGTAA